MKSTFLGMLAVATLAIYISSAANTTNTETNTIRFGVTNSTLIVSAKFREAYHGGGGASGTAKIVEAFKAPKGFKETNTIAVLWMSEKTPHELVGTNTFLLFLRPAHDVPFTAYEDATERKHSFVPATSENIRLLKSRLAESK